MSLLINLAIGLLIVILAIIGIKVLIWLLSVIFLAIVAIKEYFDNKKKLKKWTHED